MSNSGTWTRTRMNILPIVTYSLLLYMLRWVHLSHLFISNTINGLLLLSCQVRQE